MRLRGGSTKVRDFGYLSFVDSLILATALIKGCEVFVTGDADFDIAEKQKIILVRKSESIVG